MIRSEQQFVHRVVEAFGKGPPIRTFALGGTACPKFAVDTSTGRFVVRVRAEEFAKGPLVRFDHEAMRQLAEAGLPVPRPQRTADGATWIHLDGTTVELLSWKDGDPYEATDLDRITEVGRFLGRFHAVFTDGVPAGKDGFLREDHPDLLQPILDDLTASAGSPSERARLAPVADQVERVRRELDCVLYESLPKAVIHGDIHHGNLRFDGALVSAVYDFDYLSVQARCRDLCDAVMFFGSSRDEPLDFDDIRSLTQPFRPNLRETAALLGGYNEIIPLTDLDLQGLRELIRSQWVQIRLRGSRKIPPREKTAFVTDRFNQVIRWLDEESESFFQDISKDLSPAKEDTP